MYDFAWESYWVCVDAPSSLNAFRSDGLALIYAGDLCTVCRVDNISYFKVANRTIDR